ncbi:hypothetical protein DICVIV_10733 [Dictyocaulus viviparus]|uniref:Uncharacterized protein n=1 Tax=Dictyocaulus viviparus TaxID=29172 RepID=A0A0D8XLK1_DICVI|nr:hypothetical protein DICVIV_10733 [Dictyocaulus viviparus]
MDENEDEKLALQKRKDLKKDEHDVVEHTQYGEVSNREEQKIEGLDNNEVTQVGEVQKTPIIDVQETNEQTQIGSPSDLITKKSKHDLLASAEPTQYSEATDTARKKAAKKEQRRSSEQTKFGDVAIENVQTAKKAQLASCEQTQYVDVLASIPKLPSRKGSHTGSHDQVPIDTMDVRIAKSRPKEKLSTTSPIPQHIETQHPVEQTTDRREKGRLVSITIFFEIYFLVETRFPSLQKILKIV